MTEPQGERLQKVLARAGVASRRAAEGLITAGRVTVNGQRVTELGTRVTSRDEVRVDGRRIIAEEPVYYLLHKPPEMVTTLHDPEGRPCVGDLVGELTERVFPVGRLDWDAEGLLVLTNDGELANKLTHPRYGVPRTYHAKVRGAPDDAVLDQLRRGVRLEDGFAKPASVERGERTKANTWITVTVTEGRPHFVKRLFEAVGHPVQRLRRVAYGGLTLEGLEQGELRPLSKAEVRALQSKTPAAAEKGRPKGRRPGRAPRPEAEAPGGATGATGARAGKAAPERGAKPSVRTTGKPERRGPGGRGPGKPEERAPGGKPPVRGKGRQEGRGPGGRRSGGGRPTGGAPGGSAGGPKRSGRGPGGGGPGRKGPGGGRSSRGGRNGGQSGRS